MGKYIINGGAKLQGELYVNGGKNAILPIMAATILNEGENIIHNCPKISDLFITAEILNELGCDVKWDGRSIIVNSSNASRTVVSDKLVRKMRSSIVFLGSILGRFHYVKLAYPGGYEMKMCH